MAVDPEALQRALRAQFPAPELDPDASAWMREFVALVGSNPFIYRERAILKVVDEPLSRLKAEPSEVRVAFVFEALQGIANSQSFHLKTILKSVAAALLRTGVELNSLEAVRMVEAVSKKNLPFPLKAILSAIDGIPRTPALLTALHQLRGSVTPYYGQSEMKEIHAAPPISRIAASSVKLRAALTAIVTRPNIAMPTDTMTSADQRARARCMIIAPPIAPSPKHPSRMPYPSGLPLIRCATEGNSASTALAKNMAAPARTVTARIPGE